VLVIALLPAACQRPQHEPYDVLVVVLDTVRSDHVSGNGYSRKTTPAIDALAADGTSFRSAFTVAPRTWQSFVSILTGLYPPHHNVRYIYDEPLRPDVPTLSSILGSKGYDTGAFDIVPFVRGMTGGRGFDDYIDLARKPPTPAREVAAVPALPGQFTPPDALTLGVVWDWIDARRGKPFFAFVRLLGGHWPYLATPEQMDDFDSCEGQDHTFNDGSFGVGVGKKKYEGFVLSDEERYRKRFYDPGYSTATIHHMIAHYDAALRNTDASIGILIAHLRDAGLLRRTIVVITADHGEAFGETGYFTHGPKLDEAAMRVPLVIRLPDEFRRAKRGQVIDDLVRVVDIAPTVLDVVGIDPPKGLDGVSLLPALTGDTLPPLWAYAETEKSFVGVDPDAHIEGIAGKVRMMRDQNWKLLLVPKPDGPEYRLYDLREDPRETTNVYSRHPEQAAELLRRLQPILAADVGGKNEPQLTDSQKEHLRALGYR
jgi:arylsulfatase A-like enzyme